MLSALAGSLRPRLGVIVALLSLSGCVSQLTPSVFRVRSGQDVLGEVRNALAQRGMTVESVDPEAGVVETPWESTGTNADGTVWAARYLIAIAPEASMSRVTVAMDLRTCQHGLGTNPHTGRLDAASCERLPDGVTPVMYQDRLDDFAGQLRTALGAAALP